jgi:hypothetical protein
MARQTLTRCFWPPESDIPCQYIMLMSHYRRPRSKLDLLSPSRQLRSYPRLGVRQDQPPGKSHARPSNNAQARRADRSKCSPELWHSAENFTYLNFHNFERETDLDPGTLRAVGQGSTKTDRPLCLAHITNQPLE